MSEAEVTPLRALVLVHEPKLRTLVSAALAAHQIETLAASTWDDALAQRVTSQTYSLVLFESNVSLGTEAATWVTRQNAYRIALAHDGDEDVDELLARGCDDVIFAPFDLASVAKRLPVFMRAAQKLRAAVRRRSMSDVVEGERLASIGLVAAGIAHEINNPLSYVVTDLRSLEEHLSNTTATVNADEARALLAEAREGVDRVLHLVRDLGALTKRTTDERELVCVEDVLDSTANLLRHEVRRRATLLREYDRTDPIEANPARLGQVFLNLMMNALQAIEGRNPAVERIVLRTRRMSDRTVVEIEDTGSGIDDATKSRIFEPFFTTKKGTGTGLGLPISHALVTEIGGDIAVESAPGKGTRFVLTFPSTPPLERRISIYPLTLPPRRARVLIVDDEAAVGRALARVIGDHETKLITSGREALEHLRQTHDYDVIFCDVSMPDLDGPSLYSAMQSSHPELCARFLFVSGGAASPEAKAFLADGKHTVLPKPYDLKQVRAALRTALESRERLRKA